jgi:hypothetical protein
VTSFQLPYVPHAESILLRCLWVLHMQGGPIPYLSSLNCPSILFCLSIFDRDNSVCVCVECLCPKSALRLVLCLWGGTLKKCFQASLIYARSDHSLSEQLVLNTSLFSRSIHWSMKETSMKETSMKETGLTTLMSCINGSNLILLTDVVDK